jgi:DNA segregation ATPase FtsK/SpoIIIE-like protein
MSTIRQQLEKSPPAAASRLSEPSPRDVQREALHDLVALATDCAATEAQIEQQFRTSTEQAGREFEKAQYQFEQQTAALKEEAVQTHNAQMSQLHEQFMSQVAAAKENYADAREKIERDFEPIDLKTRQQLEQAIWLADSVLEVAQNQAHEDEKKIKEVGRTHGEAVDGIEQRGRKLLERYNVVAPVEDDEERKEAGQIGPDAQADMAAHLEAAQQQVQHLRKLFLPNLLVGFLPWLVLFLLTFGAVVIANVFQRSMQEMAITAGATFVGLLLLGFVLRIIGRAQVREAYKPLRQSIWLARLAAEEHSERTAKTRDAKYAAAVRKRDREVRLLKEKAAPVIKAVAQKREENLAAEDVANRQLLADIASSRDRNFKQTEESFKQQGEELDQKHAAELQAAKNKSESQLQEARRRYDEARVALEKRLRDGLSHIHSPIGEQNGNGSANGQIAHDWNDPWWQSWTPPRKFPSLLRFGQMRVDLKLIADNSKQNGHVRLELPAPFAVPAALAFPRGASLLVQHERTGREQAMRTLQTVMARILTSLPPGRARFTIIDPIGLGQNFAGFMHLADHDEALVGTRIWTESDQIEQRLADMTEHMETVIQKYLRNEFATIDDYNEQAGELAEPYRFLVVADFPNSFQGDAFRRLASIAATGARCGVYVLVARDLRIQLPSEAALDDLEAHCVNLVQDGDKFVWKDDVFGQFPLTLDAPPPEDLLRRLLDQVGKAARESKRVEVPFDTIAPDKSEFWTGDSTEELSVPIGRMGATRLQTLRFGRGVAQHALVAGKTGSGKSTLLHALVTNLAMWYSPDQIEIYLIDFKKGVEFKTYATHDLPHARAIAVESDREFGLSVLQRLDAELARRGELFRKAGVQDLASYRRSDSPLVMPRTLLVIDEFQEFFSEDDKLAQEAGLLLDRLVRQGRAFGIHLLLGSQTIGGTSGLARSTIGQMAVRIALQTSEADSQLILGDNNSAARLLSRPGEAIYNDAGGLVEANSPFQVAWLSDERREVYLDQVKSLADARHKNGDSAIVFEGNAPADIRQNARLATLLDSPKWGAAPAAATAWLGDPVAIKEPTGILLRRQSGSNVLLVGQQEEQALAVMASTIVSLAGQYRPGSAILYVLDGTPADSVFAGTFEKLKASVPQETRLVEWRAIADSINELAEQVSVRPEGDPAGQPEVFVFIYGLQRYRLLRRSEDDLGFSMSSDEPRKANPSKQFADILRDGPGVGIHVLSWVDTVASIERTLDRSSMREFDHRLLFQMSAADSSNLIDSPAANKLGFHRALAYSEEQGVMEKFRPYALPNVEWLTHVGDVLRRKS